MAVVQHIVDSESCNEFQHHLDVYAKDRCRAGALLGNRPRFRFGGLVLRASLQDSRCWSAAQGGGELREARGKAEGSDPRLEEQTLVAASRRDHLGTSACSDHLVAKPLVETFVCCNQHGDGGSHHVGRGVAHGMRHPSIRSAPSATLSS